MATDRYAHPFGRALGMRREWRSFPLATITFLGERADITGPEPGVLVAEQTTERNAQPRPEFGRRFASGWHLGRFLRIGSRRRVIAGRRPVVATGYPRHELRDSD